MIAADLLNPSSGRSVLNLKRDFGIVFLVSIVVIVAGCTADSPKDESSSHAEDVHWGYEGDTGPAQWGALSPDYVLCAEGKQQSPINIDDSSATTVALSGIKFNYRPTVLDIVNNGHTIQVNYEAGSTMEVEGAVYNLLQFHFHAASEHSINGKHSEMEMHLVHQRSDGALGVVGVMINRGETTERFAAIWAELPVHPKEERHIDDVTIDAASLLPAERTYYRYDGSLTTPPCSEGVAWFVLQSPIEMSDSQISAFTSVISKNNRPVQPLYSRGVSASASE